MISRFLIPILSLLGVLFGLQIMARNNRAVVAAPPVVEPAAVPFTEVLSGSGLTEAESENIEIATPVSGLVTDVLVTVGQKVEAGAPLFRLDVTDWLAVKGQREAAVRTAEARLLELRSFPRAESVPPAKAAVDEARVRLDESLRQLEFAKSLADPSALSTEERTRREFAVSTARAQLASAEAQLALIQAGTFAPEIAVAEASLGEARAALRQVELEIERRTVRAPLAATVLQRNIHPGEFAQAGVLANPLLLLGATNRLHVRVDIDENDAWRFMETASAKGFLRGNSQFSVPLTFVRVEPYVVPKRSLTGLSSERVDTRVLQVLYAFDADAIPVRVGQMMDVFIETANTNQKTNEGETLAKR